MLARKTETDSFYKKQLNVSHLMWIYKKVQMIKIFSQPVFQKVYSLTKLNNSQKCDFLRESEYFLHWHRSHAAVWRRCETSDPRCVVWVHTCTQSCVLVNEFLREDVNTSFEQPHWSVSQSSFFLFVFFLNSLKKKKNISVYTCHAPTLVQRVQTQRSDGQTELSWRAAQFRLFWK